MWFWSGAAQVVLKMKQMRAVENQLLALAQNFGRLAGRHYEIRAIDTFIPRAVVPLKSHDYDVHPHREEDKYIIHSVRVNVKLSEKKEDDDASTTQGPPLVLLHGYANGASYFYRNLVGLSNYFSSVHSIDLLGWGLSSRPKFDRLVDNSSERAEDFFVESLEAWRLQNKIDKMILAGHSIGGHLSIAYTERYPDNVERLILLSPAGVSERNEQVEKRWKARIESSMSSRAMATTMFSLFERGYTPGYIVRALPESRSRNMAQNYVEARLPAITDPNEQKLIANYLWYNSMLPGSGEYCLNRFLTPFAVGRNPTASRIQNLKVKSVSFFYGSQDWMDVSGGLQAQLMAQDKILAGKDAPTVDVYRVENAGHLLMLDNWISVNSGIVDAAHEQHQFDLPQRPVKIVPNRQNYSPYSNLSSSTSQPQQQSSHPNIEISA